MSEKDKHHTEKHRFLDSNLFFVFLGVECLSHFTIAALKAGTTCGPIKGCCIVEKAAEKLDLMVKHSGKSRKNPKKQKRKKTLKNATDNLFF